MREGVAAAGGARLQSTNFKVIVVHMDGGDGAAHRELLHSRIRQSFSCWGCHHLTDFFDLCFLLLGSMTKKAVLVAQMFQHSRKILKLLSVFFGLLFDSQRSD
ncbi:hypothetical protein INR49_009665, partial [Caranx melampygus]